MTNSCLFPCSNSWPHSWLCKHLSLVSVLKVFEGEILPANRMLQRRWGNKEQPRCAGSLKHWGNFLPVFLSFYLQVVENIQILQCWLLPPFNTKHWKNCDYETWEKLWAEWTTNSSGRGSQRWRRWQLAAFGEQQFLCKDLLGRLWWDLSPFCP